MNIVLVLIDSLNRHYLSPYAPTSVATPNLTAFAGKAWRMDNHFMGSAPCMPARRDILTGRKEVMWRPWGPLEPFDARLPRLLETGGYTTAIVTDHYHYWEEAANGYLQSFQSTQTIRGHELDCWQPSLPDDEPVPKWVESIEAWRPGWGRRYYANVKDFQDETDFFPAQVMTGAVDWLKKNAARQAPFFLQVESFDVHEPFHAPEPYASMYSNEANGDQFTVWPPYQNLDEMAEFMAATTPAELDFIRSQYAAKVTMVDRWFGELLKTFDELALWDDTLLIVTTDHGHDLGERGAFGKQYPHFDSHANIPMFIWHPNYPGNGQAISALTSTVDIFATILAAGDVPVPDPTHSQSMLPLLTGDESRRHQALLYGTFGEGVCCTDGEWTLFKSPEQEGPLYFYSTLIYQSLLANRLSSPTGHGHFIPGVDLPQWQIPIEHQPRSWENFLFHRRQDPEQSRNLWTAAPTDRKRMLDVLHELLALEGIPPEQYTRLGLTPT